ncbi:hypothetical protein [Methylogaea oryzae]|uniref:Uncharacterized protein n=1 Tax=Methylogaea oryzae TaxID=1295382 RepID=A0A8D5AJS1_9GAMM|nr:hypothetical protein [Methylogaea oryzae]BBL71099.1 hypothetical protein MoryE10_17050 [Methylogaea oryzae]
MIARLIFVLEQIVNWLERYNEERARREEELRRARSIRLANIEREKLARLGML